MLIHIGNTKYNLLLFICVMKITVRIDVVSLLRITNYGCVKYFNLLPSVLSHS